ncbi:hypothetical protein GPJ56_002192 [Histomonas meleagridis]|uniref:uncharacterized protein n=1 Tax=Histomonas meleagridis TaxID=135588 RepID=UPI00355A5C6E|nr:hypothetical protein GPJ56_002192 [Histomonas meleagridis]KAH0806629.1 hypothetical protein GO595_000480 [Histomonas meleagridis]
MEKLIDELENGPLTTASFVSQIFSQTEQSGALEKIDPKAALELLVQRSKQLEQDLRSEVCANSDELLANARDVKFFRDNVTSLKSQVAKTRKEAETVALSLVGPFNTIQENARKLNSTYATCKKLRLLLFFLSRVKQTKEKFTLTKITGITSEIKKLCELQKTAQTGELNNIEVFQKFWLQKKPLCDSLIRLADTQFSSSIDKNDISSSTNAACVFVHLGTLTQFSHSYYQKLIKSLCSISRSKLEKSTSETIFDVLKNDFKQLSDTLTKVDTLFQSCVSAIQKSPDAEITDFDASLISPQSALTEYSSNLSKVLLKISQQSQPISSELINRIPLIRNQLLSDGFKDQQFQIVVNAFSSFQDAFMKQSKQEMRKNFFSYFSPNRGTTPNVIALYCESIQNKLAKFDSELLMKFKALLIQLANDFVKLAKHDNAALRNQAEMFKNDVKAGLGGVAAKLFGNQAADEVIAVLAEK